MRSNTGQPSSSARPASRSSAASSARTGRGVLPDADRLTGPERMEVGDGDPDPGPVRVRMDALPATCLQQDVVERLDVGERMVAAGRTCRRPTTCGWPPTGSCRAAVVRASPGRSPPASSRRSSPSRRVRDRRPRRPGSSAIASAAPRRCGSRVRDDDDLGRVLMTRQAWRPTAACPPTPDRGDRPRWPRRGGRRRRAAPPGNGAPGTRPRPAIPGRGPSRPRR